MTKRSWTVTVILALVAGCGPSRGGPGPAPSGGTTARGTSSDTPGTPLTGSPGADADGAAADATGAEQSAAEPEPLATPQGDPLGPAATATVGAAGGELASPDGRCRLRVPAGALAADTVLSLTPVTGTFPTAVGAACRFEPSGLRFAAPAELTFTLTEEEAAARGGMGLLDLAVQGDDGLWTGLDDVTVDAGQRTVTASLAHVSTASALTGYTLEPRASRVNAGTALELWFNWCRRCSLTGAYGCSRIDRIDRLMRPELSIEDPLVNGIAPGNDEIGTAYTGGSEFRVRYNAPREIPRPDTVTVSATVYDPTNTEAGRVFVVSLLTIVKERGMTGHFGLEYQPSMMSGAIYAANTTLMAQSSSARLVFVDEGPDEINYRLEGNIELLPTSFPLDPEGRVICRVREGSRPMPPTTFKVVKNPSPAVRFQIALSWVYECPVPMSPPVQIPVEIDLGTGDGPGCMTPNDRPVGTDLDQFLFEVTADCNGLGRVKGNFSFITSSVPLGDQPPAGSGGS